MSCVSTNTSLCFFTRSMMPWSTQMEMIVSRYWYETKKHTRPSGTAEAMSTSRFP